MTRRSVFLALAVAGCGSIVIKTKELEGEIAADLTKDGVVIDRVQCPAEILAKPGMVFECSVVIGGKSYARVVEIKGASKSGFDLDMHWKRGEAVVASKVVSTMNESVAALIGVPVAVDCGEPVRFLEPDRTVRCDIAIAQTKLQIVMTLDQRLVLTSWRLDPPMLAKTKLESGLASSVGDKLGGPVTLDCGPAPVIQRPSNGVVTCTANTGKKTVPIGIEVELDKDGKLSAKRWQTIDN